MTEFQVGDQVRVALPRGYNKRGVFGISVMYSTWPEARFEGALGQVTQINPLGPQSVPQYLVDFRPYDNSRLGLPWQGQWFREEWLTLAERQPAGAVASAGPDVKAGDRSERTVSQQSEHPPAAGTRGGGPTTVEDVGPAARPGTTTIGSPDSATVATPPAPSPAPAGDAEQAAIAAPTNQAFDATAPPAVAPAAPDSSIDSDLASAAPPSHRQPEPAEASLSDLGNPSPEPEPRSDAPGWVKGTDRLPPLPEEGADPTRPAPAAVESPSLRNAPIAGWPAQQSAGGMDDTYTAALSEAPGDAAPVSIGPEDRRDANTHPGTTEAMPSPSPAATDGPRWVKGDGTRYCPNGYPIKGNSRSTIYHRLGDDSYTGTVPDICFASVEDAIAAGYRTRAEGRVAQPKSKDKPRRR